MTTSSLLRHGPGHATTLIDGLSAWMTRKGFETVGDLRGKLAVPHGADETVLERAGYVAAMRRANAKSQGPW
jgi:dihydroorotate dehydrogenase (fumarate)